MAGTEDRAKVPRTFVSGPSEPVCLADQPGTWVEIDVAAPPERVWEVVTDIDLPARFSEEFLGATWRTPVPALGASFLGRNRHRAIGEWEVECFVAPSRASEPLPRPLRDPRDRHRDLTGHGGDGRRRGGGRTAGGDLGVAPRVLGPRRPHPARSAGAGHRLHPPWHRDRAARAPAGVVVGQAAPGRPARGAAVRARMPSVARRLVSEITGKMSPAASRYFSWTWDQS